VLIYIGEAGQSTECGLKAIHELANAAARGLNTRESFFPDTSDWINLLKFFDSNYFKRLWPVQEIVLSKSAPV
jgi:hypothetical protein